MADRFMCILKNLSLDLVLFAVVTANTLLGRLSSRFWNMDVGILANEPQER